MIEEGLKLKAPSLFALGARFWFGVPVRRNVKIEAIIGGPDVKAVRISHGVKQEEIACDGVILSGQFRPENTLFHAGPLSTPHPHVHFAGNVTMTDGNVRTAGRCVVDARQLAARVRERL
jgi:thioredoxin reductase